MSSSTTLWSTTHVDQVFTYIGYSYEIHEASQKHLTLYGINELARKNRLILCRRQISNRDVRILIENNNNTDTINNKKNFNDSLNTPSNKNYEKFLYNFNKLAIACYLTALQSNDHIWSVYNIPLYLAKDTNFYVIESSPTINERYMRKVLSDNEFLNNYLNIINNLHMSVSSCLYKNLNTHLPVNNSFNDADIIDRITGDEYHHLTSNSARTINTAFNTSTLNSSTLQATTPRMRDIHLFRSFRLLGLRHRISKTNNGSQRKPYKLEPFSEIVEIRCAFDIRQFDNCSSYDCFIECEMSYYKIMPDTLLSNDLQWFNYLNNLNFSDVHNNTNGKSNNDLNTINENIVGFNHSNSRSSFKKYVNNTNGNHINITNCTTIPVRRIV